MASQRADLLPHFFWKARSPKTKCRLSLSGETLACMTRRTGWRSPPDPAIVNEAEGNTLLKPVTAELQLNAQQVLSPEKTG